jgi:hypothetical protein
LIAVSDLPPVEFTVNDDYELKFSYFKSESKYFSFDDWTSIQVGQQVF